MSTTKHAAPTATYTPGPWTILDNDRGGVSNFHIMPKNSNGTLPLVARLGEHDAGGRWHAQHEANARLIASAPEMLEALKEILMCAKKGVSNPTHYATIAARAAAKAEGR